MKSHFRSAALAIGIVLVAFSAVPSHADSCDQFDSGQLRPQSVRDRVPECGGTAPVATIVQGDHSAIPSPSTSGSLTTLFASNNGGNVNGGIYFDLQAVGASDVTITSWDTNLDDGWAGDVSVYYRTGTYSGFESSPAGWILVGTATGVTSAGADNPTHLDVGNLTIPTGATYGIAITLASTAGPNGGHAYTYGTGSNQVYNNGVLELSAGSANNVAFTTSVFSPRVWNGTIHYSLGQSATEVPTVDGVGLAVLLLLLAGAALVLVRRRRIA